MDEWLDNFQMMGISLTEGEKILMRMAIDKERRRIIALLEQTDRLKTIEQGVWVNYAEEAIDLINGK